MEVAKTVIEVADVAWKAMECVEHFHHHDHDHHGEETKAMNWTRCEPRIGG